MFKLIFYLIIITIWVISNTKKQGKWEEKIPDFPEEPPPSPKTDRTIRYQEPMREGAFEDFKTTPEEALSYKEKSTLPRKKIKKLQKPKLVPPVTPEIKPVQPIFAPKIAAPLPSFSEEPIYLKSSVKEGIIWSIILGPPRSKLRFDWKRLPIRR